MDLGCGTGILSLFCAKLGGARKVHMYYHDRVWCVISKIFFLSFPLLLFLPPHSLHCFPSPPPPLSPSSCLPPPLLSLQVYAVEASDMANHVSQLVDLNGLGGQVEVLQIKAEEVELEENVDLIISEWMGTLLLV